MTNTKELLEAVRQGRAHEVPGLLKPMAAAERRAALAGLKELRREVRGWGWERRQEQGAVQRALLVAGAGCHTGAAAAATWIGGRELRDWRPLPGTDLLDVLADRDPAWLGDVAHRLAARAATAAEDYPFIADLVRLAKCPVPTTDAFVHGWAESLIEARPSHASRATLPLALRSDPHVRELVPRLFETVEPAPALSWYGDPEAPNHWPSALAGLAEDGVVDRSVLVDGCVARLVRGGRPADLRFFLIVLKRLALTPAEEHERAADWIAMAADAPSSPAGHAQEVLARLAGSGGLTAGQLAEMSAAVLFRPEKKLVRAQLVLIGKVLRRDPAAAGDLLPVVAEVFGHEDTGIQERALKLVGRHIRAGRGGRGKRDERESQGVDATLRSELAGFTGLLSPVHRALAAELFGEAVEADDSAPYEETLPPVSEPVRTAPAPGTVEETVELTVALITSRSASVAEFERALDGLVRHAHRDRAALAAALRPALADRWWLDEESGGDASDLPSAERFDGMEIVAAAVLDRVSVRSLRDGRIRGGATAGCVHQALDAVVTDRLREIAYRVRTRPLPFLLATPTWENGALDAGGLVERLSAYQRLCADPAPSDVAQALLRVRRTGSGTAASAAAATALGTREGERLAAWLTADGDAAPLVRRVHEPNAQARPHWWDRTREAVRHIVLETRERLVLQRDFPQAFHRLGRPYSGSGRCYHWSALEDQRFAVLPGDRDTLAAWTLPEVTACATAEERGNASLLPRLVECGGPAGEAMHLAVACGLGARHAEDRLAAVDALLVLAARGELDGGRLGRDVAELLRLGTVKPNRLADAARTAAATGAYATTWSVLGAVLPGLLNAGDPPRGTGEILAVAADCVERCGAAVEPAGVAGPAGLAELAARGGSSRLVAQAKRLLTAIRQSHDQPRTQIAKYSR
ncbi:DUF6493 family protein [Streptomyces sp. NPDC059909]|uniref:DUF6493 family protein n=1 Tax=Streptomyces sp. NPDC059909 TaxID=3346998 RepID=UPI00365A17BD